MKIKNTLKYTACMFGTTALMLASTSTGYAEEEGFFDSVSSFFERKGKMKLDSSEPGDHQTEHTAHNQYPQTAMDRSTPPVESSEPGDHRVSRSVHKEYPALALEDGSESAKLANPDDAYEITAESKSLPFPADALPGECYAQVIVPASYETRSEQVLVQDASTRYEVVPAEYAWVEKQVLVKPEETRLEIVPAEYKTVSEKVMIEPAREEVVSVPATFKMVEEKVLVRPASKVWMDGEVEVSKPSDLSGDVVCLVEKPAEYKTVSRRVIDQPARTEVKTIPAQYDMVEKRVLVSAATTREQVIPAEYKTVKVRELVTAAQRNEIAVEPKYETVTRNIETKPAYTAWERVLCETSVDPVLAYEVEERLKAKGYNPGPLDGEIDAETEAAIEEYQVANNLPKGGLTPQTLESLGIVEFES